MFAPAPSSAEASRPQHLWRFVPPESDAVASIYDHHNGLRSHRSPRSTMDCHLSPTSRHRPSMSSRIVSKSTTSPKRLWISSSGSYGPPQTRCILVFAVPRSFVCRVLIAIEEPSAHGSDLEVLRGRGEPIVIWFKGTAMEITCRRW